MGKRPCNASLLVRRFIPSRERRSEGGSSWRVNSLELAGCVRSGSQCQVRVVPVASIIEDCCPPFARDCKLTPLAPNCRPDSHLHTQPQLRRMITVPLRNRRLLEPCPVALPF